VPSHKPSPDVQAGADRHRGKVAVSGCSFSVTRQAEFLTANMSAILWAFLCPDTRRRGLPLRHELISDISGSFPSSQPIPRTLPQHSIPSDSTNTRLTRSWTFCTADIASTPSVLISDSWRSCHAPTAGSTLCGPFPRNDRHTFDADAETLQGEEVTTGPVY
jgi:hypothetical protein